MSDIITYESCSVIDAVFILKITRETRITKIEKP